MGKIRTSLLVVFFTFSLLYCHGESINISIFDEEKIYTEIDNKIAMSPCIIDGLFRWRRNNGNWATKSDSILQTQQVLDSVVSFIKRDRNCSYVVIFHVNAFGKTMKPDLMNRSSRLLKDYLVWSGVDSMSLWLALDTIPNDPIVLCNESKRQYFEIIKIKNRQFSGWIKDGRNNFLPNAYLYGVVMNNVHGGWERIGRCDSTGRFVCLIPNVPMTIVIKDESQTELMRVNLEEGDLIDKKIRIPPKNISK